MRANALALARDQNRMSKTLTKDDFCRAAKRLRCHVAAIKAVAEVESRGEGFYADGFPVILFERHIFRKYTKGRFTKDHPDLSGEQGNYGKAGQHQRDKFNAAFALDPNAAMMSCSWGKFQIMGFNFETCGYSSVGAFVDAMKESEGKQLDAFVEFVLHNGLAVHLRSLQFDKFARGYNGPKYKENHYDTKMGSAYAKFHAEGIDCSNTTVVKEAAAPAEPEAKPAEPLPAVEVPAVTAAPTEAVPGQQAVTDAQAASEDPLQRIGNKAAAIWTAIGTTASAVFAALAGASVEIVGIVVAGGVILGGLYMIIRWRRSERKADREEETKRQAQKIAAENEMKLIMFRETHANELQRDLVENAARQDRHTVTITPPPVTLPNSDDPDAAQ